MSEEDRSKWNQRYREDSYRKTNPVDLLTRWLPQIPPGRALDVACGAGRNSLFLAEAGFEVDAIDISAVGLQRVAQQADERGLAIRLIEHDLDLPFEFECDYDLILVLWFVDLDLVTRLCDCLAPGGYLISEEHLQTDAQVIGPSSAEFRVASGALRAAVAGLDILLYEESIEPIPEGGNIASARVVARRPLPGN